MSGDDRGEASDARERGSQRTRSKALLDEVFGDVLPDGTRDDLADDEGWADGAGARADAAARHEAELRRNVPPHHG